MRLDQYISQATSLSRKDAKTAISTGKVQVDGAVVRKGNSKISQDAVVTLNGDPCQIAGERYLMLHKPANYLCATEDPTQPIVLDLLPLEWRNQLKIVGRLDKDTTGLLLLTTDGQWLHRITSPKHHLAKRYRVWLARPIENEQLAQLEQGILLRSETKPTLPAKTQSIGPQEVLLTLEEGRYHQVKRMFAAVGNHVERLHREAIGELTLADLAEGQYRELTPAEISLFHS